MSDSSRLKRLLWTLVIGGLLACGDSTPGRSDYVQSGCPRCHGSDLSGNRLGPPLHGLDAFWDQAGLESFLAKPDSFRVSDDRLRIVAARNPTPMPTFVMPDSLRGSIAAYLLSPRK